MAEFDEQICAGDNKLWTGFYGTVTVIAGNSR